MNDERGTMNRADSSFILHRSSFSPLESAPLKRLGALFLLLVVACGKRGDPHPPVPVIPKATTDLVVAQRGSKVLLSWSYPAMTTAGKSLTNIRRVIVYRTVEPLPVVQPPQPDTTTTPQAIGAFANVPPLSPAQFVKLRNKLDSIEGANLPAASNGARLTYEDTPATHSSDSRPVRLTYAVVTEGGTSVGDLSNLASIVPLDVATPPTALTATAKPNGVTLTWSAPQTAIAPNAKVYVSGYNIYRLGQGETMSELTKPINTAPVKETTYTDAPPYAAYTYVVTAVSGPGAESEPSAGATVTFKDLTPPPAPKNLQYLLETKAVRLLWDPVDAPDLAGYKVYRTEGVGHEPNVREIGTVPMFAAPVTTTYAVDTGADPGIAYKYAVTAVDKNGNESERVWTGWVVVPKTP
jgi:fibronectin type 3 domain-containing protein